MSALFSNPNARGASSSASGASGGRVLVEFRAGKMNFDENSKRVTPDKRKGLIQIEQGEDQLMHFRWRERGSSSSSVNPEDELIIFPDDVEYKRVKECTTGRVFVLKFKASDKLRFFWMQEPKEDKDEEYCKKVNESLNNPPSANTGVGGSRGGSNASSASTAASLAGLADAAGLDLSSMAGSEGGLEALLNNMSQPQLMQLFGAGADAGGSALLSALGSASAGRQRSSGNRVAAKTTSSGSGSSSNNNTSKSSNAKTIKVSDLQSVLSGIQGAQSEGDQSSSTGNVVNLAHGLNNESLLRSLLSNEAFVARMKQHVPQSDQIKDDQHVSNEIRDTVTSSHFQGLMSEFSSAFASGELGPMMREFELPEACVNAAEVADMEAFVNALQEAESSKKKKEDKPEDMALD